MPQSIRLLCSRVSLRFCIQKFLCDISCLSSRTNFRWNGSTEENWCCVISRMATKQEIFSLVDKHFRKDSTVSEAKLHSCCAWGKRLVVISSLSCWVSSWDFLLWELVPYLLFSSWVSSWEKKLRCSIFMRKNFINLPKWPKFEHKFSAWAEK